MIARSYMQSIHIQDGIQRSAEMKIRFIQNEKKMCICGWIIYCGEYEETIFQETWESN